MPVLDTDFILTPRSGFRQNALSVLMFSMWDITDGHSIDPLVKVKAHCAEVLTQKHVNLDQCDGKFCFS